LLEDGRRVAPLRTVEIAPGAEAALRAMVGSLQLYDAYQDASVAIVVASGLATSACGGPGGAPLLVQVHRR